MVIEVVGRGIRPTDCGMELKSSLGAQTRASRIGTFNFPKEAQTLEAPFWPPLGPSLLPYLSAQTRKAAAHHGRW